jgi:hypothetical protein
MNCLDFGHEPGFYMSNEIYHCLEWGQKNARRWQNETGIVIFALPKKFPKSYKYKELEDVEWRNVCTLSRICDEDHFSKIDYIEKYDFLYGQMVGNINELNILKSENKIQKYIAKPHNNPKFQLVSKTNDADEYLTGKIIACCYFMKNIDN